MKINGGFDFNGATAIDRRLKTLENQVQFLKGQIDGIRQLVVENNASLAMLISVVNEEVDKGSKQLNG